MNFANDTGIIPKKSNADIPLTPNLQPVVELSVTTATAIIYSSKDPYLVLVADNAHHRAPILPGGKQDVADGKSGLDPGLVCVLREVTEETGATLCEPTLIGSAMDPNRDIRVVPARILKGTLTSENIDHLSDADLVRTHYGCPDAIYTGYVDESTIKKTDELSNLRFIDIRHLEAGDLSAGHDVVVMWYRSMLDRGEKELPAGALKDFSLEAQDFTRA